MKKNYERATYITPSDSDVLEAYINKNSFRRSEARKLKRELRKLRLVSEHGL